jgi:hypothetical protein
VVITADALQTHPEAAEFLVTEKRAHYLFTVKANQSTLLDRCQRLPWQCVPVLDRTRDRGHGRIELRTLKAVSVNHFGFSHTAQVIQVTHKTRELHTRRWRTVQVYAVTSLRHARASPARLSELIRGTGHRGAAPSPRHHLRRGRLPGPHRRRPSVLAPCATWSSGCCAGRGRSTPPRQCAVTPVPRRPLASLGITLGERRSGVFVSVLSIRSIVSMRWFVLAAGSSHAIAKSW